jgi:glutathione synthase/RimK-type ligase-like ATP-grasp enzyme
MIKDIYLLIDYRGAFYSTIRNRWGLCSMDISRLQAEFQNHGYFAHVVRYSDIDLRKIHFKGCLVAYQSAEDSDSRYKDYIEDLLLGIQLQGGVLIPHFHCFRAHHNKVFMEILRDLSTDSKIQYPEAKSFGILEDFQKWNRMYPKVIKKAWGAGSSGVELAKTPDEAMKIATRFSKSASLIECLKEYYRRWRRCKAGYVPTSLHRNKFIVQDFIGGLRGDFKVLVYWDKYFIVSRENRPGDFRASGSGRLNWPEDPSVELLNYARQVFKYFDVPMASLDIAMSGNEAFLIEFQFVNFGPAAMELSKWHFVATGKEWKKAYGTSVPETEFARSIVEYEKERCFSRQVEA